MKKYDLAFWKATGMRVLYTVAEVALSYITIGMAFSEVQWSAMLSVSFVAGLYSMLKCIVVGVPEVKDEEVIDK